VNAKPLDSRGGTGSVVTVCRHLKPPRVARVEDLSVDIVDEGGTTVAHIRGEVDMATCERLRDSIEPYLGPRQTVILDLSDITFMDSSMLHLLVQARGRLTEDGGSLVLRNPSDAARRLLEISEMSDLLEAAGREPEGS
jgi:anti-sigma B factor antagonist